MSRRNCAFELHFVDRLVGAVLREAHRLAERGDAQHPSTGDDQSSARSSVPAWNTVHSSLSAGSCVIVSPLRGDSG